MSGTASKRERLVRALSELVDALVPAPAPVDDLVSQVGSQLGNRRHCRIVRERLARGLPGAFRDQRLYLLTREAYNEERRGLGLLPRPPLKAKPPAAADEEDRAYAETWADIRGLRDDA